MPDPFFNGGGDIVHGAATKAVHSINVAQMKAEKAISAYRHNIALPDVHIADRNEEFVPKIVGEDGEELTIERRRELMAGKKPMCDENGELRSDENYTEQFDDDIEQERLGKTAEENRPGMRIVQPRELELQLDIDDTTVKSSEGTPVVHD